MHAQRIFANEEAVALARRGLALLGKMPGATEHSRKALDVQITLAFSLLFTRGYGVQEVQENMARARELCQSLGDTAQLFPVLFGLWLYYITAPELRAARRTAEHILDIARPANHPPLPLMPLMTLAISFQPLSPLGSPC